MIPFIDLSHEQLDELAKDHARSMCWSCYQAEPIPRNVFIICCECGHVWTKRSLQRAWRKMGRQLDRRWWRHPRNHLRRAKNIFFCPECIHDF